ncbi:axial regulator yabby 4-like [Moniliophthora roreri MCA 2997]|uniref:Axial regulator yabby 4-like n=2 Tax=Moniliophthora roreri TaxID=221103 RepID=V2YCW3_MONRO|nr:axial regulator yabby 4-like [Moniliophthora roreri MCA 2997]KAI3605882.1 axial regulator yabby 4-like [Moniliophthora roreri]
MPKVSKSSTSDTTGVPKASKAKGEGKTEKQKRDPSAWTLFLKDQLKPWKDANKNKSHKEAMTVMAEMWKDHPSNPNRGKPTKPKKSKASGDASTSSEQSRSSPVTDATSELGSEF